METTLKIPCPPFDLTLSTWDQRFVPLYSKRILCFSLPSTNAKSMEQITQLLFQALQSTVEELPFLAGSIERLSRESPWVHKIRSQGAAYLEVKDYSHEISFPNLRKSRFPSALLDSEKLCPLPKAVYNRDEDFPADVCRFRANFVEGGLLLVTQIAHTICDGRGISDVLAIFADRLREAQTGGPAQWSTKDGESKQSIYTFDRTSVLAGNGRQGAIENHPWLTILPLKLPPRAYLNTKILCTNFHISKESRIALKEAASPSTALPSALRPSDNIATNSAEPPPFISTHDAITALIWRSILLARHRAGVIPADATTACCCPVDCRARLNLPDPYYGNAIYGVQCALPLSELISGESQAPQISGLQITARIIRDGIKDVTADRFRDMLDFVKRTQLEAHARLANLHDLTVSSLLLTSYYGFPMHELDFGEALGGKIEAFRLPSQGLLPGMPVILPQLPDGGCEFVISEPEEVMAFLAEDEVFQRFVSKQFDSKMKVDQVVSPI